MPRYWLTSALWETRQRGHRPSARHPEAVPHEVAEAARARPEVQILTDQVPLLIPVYGATLPVGAEPSSLADIDPQLLQPIVAALASAWLLNAARC